MAKLQDKLTDKVARKLPVPTKAQEIHWCPHTPGFGLRITRDNARSFVVEMSIGGKTVRRTIAPFENFGRGGISTEAARVAAESLRVELRGGKDRLADVRAERVQRRAAITFTEALTTYVNDPTINSGKGLKDRTRGDYLEMLRPELEKASGFKRQPGELNSLADVPLDRMTGVRIKELFSYLMRKRGPSRAAYAMRVLRAVLRYYGTAIEGDPFSLTTAKALRVQLPQIPAKDRAIEPDELLEWWAAADKAANGDYLQMLLLTGCRRGELSGLSVSDVDLRRGRMTITETKNRKKHIVMLSRQALAIVTRRVAGKGVGDPLFDGCGDPRKSIQSIIDATGIAFSAHDLRRTFALLAGARLPGLLVKRMLNHSTRGDVTAHHYASNFDEDTLREAWQTIADVIAPPTEPVADNVIELENRARRSRAKRA